MIDIVIFTLVVLTFLGVILGLIFDFSETVVLGCFIAFIVLLFIILGLAFSESESEHNRLIRQCMDDGKKEYECEALMRKPQSNVTHMPIVIPVR